MVLMLIQICKNKINCCIKINKIQIIMIIMNKIKTILNSKICNIINIL